MAHLTIENMAEAEKLLWDRVSQLWKCSEICDMNTIEQAIHPEYIGWDNTSLLPHDRSYAINSIIDKSVRLLEYSLFPLGISVYDEQVGIVNYRYKADISDVRNNIRNLKGRWTEIYLNKNNDWILIGVHGGPESADMVSTANIYSISSKVSER